MTIKEKIMLDAIAVTMFALVCFGMVLLMKKQMGTQTDAESDANMKRLFGKAWKEAKDL